MNAKTLIAGLLTTLAAAGAFASEFNGEAFYQQPQAGVSSVSRAQVKADLARAIAAGNLIQGDVGYKFSDGVSTRSRAEVRAEVLSAARGELAYGDAIYKFPDAVSTSSRAQVRAEVLKAASEGNLLRSDA